VDGRTPEAQTHRLNFRKKTSAAVGALNGHCDAAADAMKLKDVAAKRTRLSLFLKVHQAAATRERGLSKDDLPQVVLECWQLDG
jgi:hypothetical protein